MLPVRVQIDAAAVAASSVPDAASGGAARSSRGTGSDTKDDLYTDAHVSPESDEDNDALVTDPVHVEAVVDAPPSSRDAASEATHDIHSARPQLTDLGDSVDGEASLHRSHFRVPLRHGLSIAGTPLDSPIGEVWEAPAEVAPPESDDPLGEVWEEPPPVAAAFDEAPIGEQWEG